MIINVPGGGAAVLKNTRTVGHSSQHRCNSSKTYQGSIFLIRDVFCVPDPYVITSATVLIPPDEVSSPIQQFLYILEPDLNTGAIVLIHPGEPQQPEKGSYTYQDLINIPKLGLNTGATVLVYLRTIRKVCRTVLI